MDLTLAEYLGAADAPANGLPPAHPLRAALHNEVHARRPEAMTAPLVISHIVMLCDAADRLRSHDHLAALLLQHGLAAPDPSVSHVRSELPDHRLRRAGGVVEFAQLARASAGRMIAAARRFPYKRRNSRPAGPGSACSDAPTVAE